MSQSNEQTIDAGGATDVDAPSARLPVLKTYKLYIDGKFPRTESGRYYLLKGADGRALANIAQSSRKDFRDAVVAARAAQPGWAARSAYNRAQILYRIAEMLEGRTAQFVDEIAQTSGAGSDAALAQVQASVDRLVYYAGWADKYQQLFSTVNPVSSSHFNFSVVEPTGVVAIAPPQSAGSGGGLLPLVSLLAPAICGGNVAISLAPVDQPLSAVTLAEVLATSDLPGGVVNLLTGNHAELLETVAHHMDVNAIVFCRSTQSRDAHDSDALASLREKAAANVKRIAVVDAPRDWASDGDDAQSPYAILRTLEVKTTWHPIGV